MTTFEVIKYIFFFNFFIVFLEFAYSLYKKDGIYSKLGTINNIINGIIINLISPRMFVIYFTIFLKYYNFFHIDLDIKFGLLNFIVCLFFVDFMYYIFHRLHHSVRIFWTLHSVHHGDNKLNLSTALRVSWFEQLYIYLIFVPIILVGFHPLTIFLAFYLLSEYQFYCHSQYFRLPRVFNLFLITPNNHRTHHDNIHAHQASNYGGVFSIWDRMFGTYTEEISEFNPGIKNFKEENVLRFEFVPIINYCKSIWKK